MVDAGVMDVHLSISKLDPKGDGPSSVIVNRLKERSTRARSVSPSGDGEASWPDPLRLVHQL